MDKTFQAIVLLGIIMSFPEATGLELIAQALFELGCACYIFWTIIRGGK